MPKPIRLRDLPDAEVYFSHLPIPHEKNRPFHVKVISHNATKGDGCLHSLAVSHGIAEMLERAEYLGMPCTFSQKDDPGSHICHVVRILRREGRAASELTLEDKPAFKEMLTKP